jgi:hypothetical protein
LKRRLAQAQTAILQWLAFIAFVRLSCEMHPHRQSAEIGNIPLTNARAAAPVIFAILLLTKYVFR